MPSAAAIGPVQEAVVTRVRTSLLSRLFDVSQSPTPARAVVAVHESDAPQPPIFPYVIVGGGSREEPFNTLGDALLAKWGGTVTVPIRLVTKFPTTEPQMFRMWDAIKGAVENTKFDVTGFGRGIADCRVQAVLTDTNQGVVTRELVGEVDLTVHQGS